jgi:hypothetical protein
VSASPSESPSPSSSPSASAAPYSGVLKRYDGTSWVKEPLKTYTGGSFQSKSLYYWDSLAWVEVDISG